jgi:dTDP-4-amino-4,6-dideoxygalactose transaminase
MIPIARPDIGPEEVAAVTEVLTSGMIAQGKRWPVRGALG